MGPNPADKATAADEHKPAYWQVLAQRGNSLVDIWELNDRIDLTALPQHGRKGEVGPITRHALEKIVERIAIIQLGIEPEYFSIRWEFIRWDK